MLVLHVCREAVLGKKSGITNVANKRFDPFEVVLVQMVSEVELEAEFLITFRTREYFLPRLMLHDHVGLERFFQPEPFITDADVTFEWSHTFVFFL